MQPPKQQSGDRERVSRAEAIQRIIEDRDRRRARGERLSDRHIIETHPNLSPELGEALRAARGIRRAISEARRLQPMVTSADRDPLKLLDDDELFASLGDAESSPATGHPKARQATPTIVGYAVYECLGIGGQAAVYRAVQESTGRQVAIKVLSGGDAATSRQRERFCRESVILASLDHPNIVPIMDRGRTTDESFYFVMPLLAGLELDAYVSQLRETRDYTAILALFQKISDAVGEAHRKGVVHRDLKPSNVRLNDRGEPFVTDFGLARPDDGFSADDVAQLSLTQEGQIIGSLPWASPEQVNATPNWPDSDDVRRPVHFRSDVYGIGVMLYHALTGRFPYTVYAPTITVVANILTARPKRPSRYMGRMPGLRKAALDHLVLKCLQKDAANRYPDAATLARELQLLALGKRLSDRSGQFCLRSRYTLAMALASVSASAGVYWWNSPVGDPVVEVIDLPSLENSAGMRFVRIPAGVVLTGSPLAEQGRSGHEVQRSYRLDEPFYLATKEVTVGQYRRVMGSIPAGNDGPENLPARNVSYAEAEEFCRRLSLQEPDRNYRLPDEVEWEYACRAGTKGAIAGTAQIESMAWYQDNSGGAPHLVGSKSPNQWGLFDMHGNVAELCRRRFPDDPQGNILRPLRGGSYDSPQSGCRSAYRGSTSAPAPTNGFRIVCDTPSKSP